MQQTRIIYERYSREEKEEWINGLAEIYQKQGLRVVRIANDGIENEIKQKIIATTGLSDVTVTKYLHDEFKQDARQGAGAPSLPILEKAEKALGEEGFKKLDCNKVKQYLESNILLGNGKRKNTQPKLNHEVETE